MIAKAENVAEQKCKISLIVLVKSRRLNYAMFRLALAGGALYEKIRISPPHYRQAGRRLSIDLRRGMH